MILWKAVVDKPYKNCRRIYPIQQRVVQELIRNLSQISEVERIIIFGSSVT